jgi:Uma2 family endonuclease
MFYEGPPDFIIEISSPSTRDYDLKQKSTVYMREGVEEYWVIDDEDRKVVVFQKTKEGFSKNEFAGADKVFSSAIEKFWIMSKWLWQKTMPGVSDCLKEITGG